MTRPVRVPDWFVENAARTWGEAGRTWAARLPEQVDEFCGRWGLQLDQADFTLSYNYVAAVRRAGGERAVLKLGVPTKDFLGELSALDLYAGEGMCRLLESDARNGAMLLERVEPGVPLLELGETDGSVAAAASVMRRLRRQPSPEHPLPALVDWWVAARDGLRRRFGTAEGPFPPGFVAEADEIYADVFATEVGHVALHGDLHHWNILSSGREGWLAIDPHGVTGPPECEVGAFMMNPNNGALVRPDVRAVLSRRLDQLADELGFEREQLRRVSFAYAVLSSAWSTEDGGERWKPGIDIARALRDL